MLFRSRGPVRTRFLSQTGDKHEGLCRSSDTQIIALRPWPTQKKGGACAFVASRNASAPKSPTLFFHSPPLSAQFPLISPTLSFLSPPTHGTAGEPVGDGAHRGAGGSENHSRLEDQLGDTARLRVKAKAAKEKFKEWLAWWWRWAWRSWRTRRRLGRGENVDLEYRLFGCRRENYRAIRPLLDVGTAKR